MPIKARKKFHQSILFRISLVLLVMFVQLIWWVIFTLRDTQYRIDQIDSQIESELKFAEKLLDNSSDKIRGLNYIRDNLKSVIVTDSHIEINHDYRDHLVNRESDKRLMFISESSLFFLFILLSIYLVYRSFREELRLRLLQQNFMLSITHELKTPIASIKLYLQTIQNKPDMNREKQKLFLENGLSEVNRLNELIENILYTVKLESEPKVMAEIPQNLSETVARIIKANETVHGISIIQNIETNIYHSISIEAMELVLNNLISNSIKYSHSDPKINITLSLKESEINIRLADMGIGIPDSEKDLIFNRFYRIGNEENRDTKGTGIGLYIVRQIIRLAKGTVICEDNKPNGSVFSINLQYGMKREN